jgi:two-component system NtrC family sensor kinase
MVVWLFISILAFVIYAFFINKYWEKKVQEKARLIKDTEAQLIHMEKMASLGILAAGIAHEINNPLSFMVSNLETLEDYSRGINESVSSGNQINKALIDDLISLTHESLEGALRIKKIVQDLRTFSRRSETQKVPIDVNQVLESTLSIVWNEIKYKIVVVKDYQAKTNILADPTQLSQVFLNILINASQAIQEKGTVTISTYEDGKNIYIKFKDTGCGIPPDVLPKIFDPFFSTKKGTGLGLSVSYNIIKHYAGQIQVESRVGMGSTFTVSLPKPKEIK